MIKNAELKDADMSCDYPEKVINMARLILTKVMEFRRMIESDESCDSPDCYNCHLPHLDKVSSAVTKQEPIIFVLPAFPGKSPNLAKVLGVLPDMAEKRALIFLNDFCRQIKEIYEPGAEIIICSDGRVFSDLVGIQEKHISAYQLEVDRIIEKLNLTALSTFNLDDVYVNADFDHARSELIEVYGQDLEALRRKVKKGSGESGNQEEKAANRMYCGLTRFLVEDLSFPGQTKSRSAIQKEARQKAYQVVIRSNAWTELIAERFPHAVRLSIHPQACGSSKAGIQFFGEEVWMTPWHGVAVKVGDGYILMRNKDAEDQEAKLILDENGRPSHYELIQ